MPMMRKFLALALAAVLVLVSALAGEDAPGAAGEGGATPSATPLPVNGDFRGAPAGDSPVPGWILVEDGGHARVVPSPAPDKFVLELQATPARAQGVVSEAFPVSGGVLECFVTLSGSGAAFTHYDCLDAKRALLFIAEPGRHQLGAAPRTFSFTAPMAPNVRFVRLRFAAAAGSVARIENVRAVIRHDLPEEPAAPAMPEAPAKPETPAKPDAAQDAPTIFASNFSS